MSYYVAGIIASLATLVLVAWLGVPAVLAVGDLGVFADIGLSAAMAAYGDTTSLVSEYPPFASFVFSIFYLASQAFHLSFRITWLGGILFLLLSAGVYVWVRFSVHYAFIFWSALAGAGLLLSGDMMYARYDVLIGLFLLLGWIAWKHQRFYDGSAWFALAMLLKAIPVVILPLLVLTVSRKRRLHVSLFLVCALGICMLLPVGFMGASVTFDNLSYFFDYHSERGFEVGTSWVSVRMLVDVLRGEKTLLVNHHRAVHLEGAHVTAVRLSAMLAFSGLVVLYGYVWTLRDRLRADDVLPLSLAVLLWVLGVGTVLSPQFFMWILPLALAWLLESTTRASISSRGAAALLGSIVALGLLTQRLIMNGRFHLLIVEQTPEAVVTLFARNVFIFVLFLIVLVIWYREYHLTARNTPPA